MKSPLSPNDIEVLLWCHTRPEKHERYDAPAVYDALIMWERAGMVARERGSSTFPTTEKGRAMVEALCRTPEPRQVWLDSIGDVLTP